MKAGIAWVNIRTAKQPSSIVGRRTQHASLGSLIKAYIAGIGADLILERAKAVSVVVIIPLPVWLIVSSMVHRATN